MQVAIGTQDFIDLVKNSEKIVDKTLLIKEIIESNTKVILITAPRRWGKSVNMSMLKTFLQIKVDKDGKPVDREKTDEYKVFFGGEIDLGFADKKDLKELIISSDLNITKRQGQYPVIYLDFKDCKGNSYEELENSIRGKIYQVFQEHNYLLNSDKLSDEQIKDFKEYIKSKKDIQNLNLSLYINPSLKFLSECLKEHHGQRAWILIDEYDTPLTEAYGKFKKEDFEKVADLFRNIFGSALKGNNNLEKGLITGVMRIAKDSFLSGLNNVKEHSMLEANRYNKFYGFSQEEVDSLLKAAGLESRKQEVEEWYNGYKVLFLDKDGNSSLIKIYNANSIIEYLNTKLAQSFWTNTGSIEKILKYEVLEKELIETDLASLISGKSVEKELDKSINLRHIDTNRNTLYSTLAHAGYLTIEQAESYIYKFSIPNREIKEDFEKVIRGLLASKYGVDNPNSFIKALFEESTKNFETKIANTLLSNTSFHDTKNENSYHMLMNGILVGGANGKYKVESNIELGAGRSDTVIIPRSKEQGDTAIVLEYKIAENKDKLEEKAQEAMQQIIDQKYAEPILEKYGHIIRIRRVGMAFYKKHIFICKSQDLI